MLSLPHHADIQHFDVSYYVFEKIVHPVYGKPYWRQPAGSATSLDGATACLAKSLSRQPLQCTGEAPITLQECGTPLWHSMFLGRVCSPTQLQ